MARVGPPPTAVREPLPLSFGARKRPRGLVVALEIGERRLGHDIVERGMKLRDERADGDRRSRDHASHDESEHPGAAAEDEKNREHHDHQRLYGDGRAEQPPRPGEAVVESEPQRIHDQCHGEGIFG